MVITAAQLTAESIICRCVGAWQPPLEIEHWFVEADNDDVKANHGQGLGWTYAGFNYDGDGWGDGYGMQVNAIL